MFAWLRKLLRLEPKKILSVEDVYRLRQLHRKGSEAKTEKQILAEAAALASWKKKKLPRLAQRAAAKATELLLQHICAISEDYQWYQRFLFNLADTRLCFTYDGYEDIVLNEVVALLAAQGWDAKGSVEDQCYYHTTRRMHLCYKIYYVEVNLAAARDLYLNKERIDANNEHSS